MSTIQKEIIISQQPSPSTSFVDFGSELGTLTLLRCSLWALLSHLWTEKPFCTAKNRLALWKGKPYCSYGIPCQLRAGFFNVGLNPPLWHQVLSAQLSLPCRLAHSNLHSPHEKDLVIGRALWLQIWISILVLKNLQLNWLKNGIQVHENSGRCF